MRRVLVTGVSGVGTGRAAARDRGRRTTAPFDDVVAAVRTVAVTRR
jgi:hypothetical protein